MIKIISLDHPGGFYHYRIHYGKLNKLCNSYEGLQRYLTHVFASCPDKHFHEGPRSSALKFKIPVDPVSITGHETSKLALHGLHENRERFKTAHSRVQVFMLENDNNTVAMEVPIWLHRKELEVYESFFGEHEPLSGHIDVLRIEDGNIWIWDYKPNAHKEKYAATQVYFYALMLSARTGISLDHFRCGYFDHTLAYVFKPRGNITVKNEALKNFI